ncbi:50S ribosomal protein L6 [Candidatus Woesearchaeota archaeon]|nr:50S ribosomal protein L6 [Candidatus Woesearchaeota archaeon]
MKKKKNSENKAKTSIDLPEGVKASLDNNSILLIKGPKGESRREIRQRKMQITVTESSISLESREEKKEDKKITNSLAAHIRNMIKGSLQNHVYTLKICAGHFPINASISNKKLIVKNFLGEKVPRVLDLKDNADVKVEGELIHVSSASKEIAGQVSADIEQLTRRPGYDTRVFQDGIYIISKDGKELK